MVISTIRKFQAQAKIKACPTLLRPFPAKWSSGLGLAVTEMSLRSGTDP